MRGAVTDRRGALAIAIEVPSPTLGRTAVVTWTPAGVAWRELTPVEARSEGWRGRSTAAEGVAADLLGAARYVGAPPEALAALEELTEVDPRHLAEARSAFERRSSKPVKRRRKL